jgi:glycerate dehydrogenase
MPALRIVLLDGFTADPDGAWPELGGLGELVVYPRSRPDELAARAAGARALITNKAVLDGALIRALPDLAYIGVSATGTNVVDLPAARERGVTVTNVPGYSTESVAQLVFAYLLHFAVDVAGHDGAVKAGGWAASADFSFTLRPLGELAGKTLVVVGLGAIGRAVARIATGFGMKVLAAAVPGRPAGDRVPLAEALPQAHAVTLHCPWTAKTDRLVDAGFLAQLRPGAVLINTSRGGLVDEAALVDTLASGRLGGVGLDVLGREPPPPEHRLTNPAAPWSGRVIVTPHLAWATIEARARLRREVAENLAAFTRGEARNRVA